MTSTEMNESAPERAVRRGAPARGRRPESVSPSAAARSASDMRDAWADARSRELRRNAYPPVLGSVLRAGLAPAGRRVGPRARDVRPRCRSSSCCRCVDHAKDTEFGRAHGFASIRGYEDFARRVPVGDYDAFSPYIDRMRAGERNLLVPEFVRYFGNSSGSSNQGKPKFLPITERQIRHQQRAGTDTVMRYLRWSGDERTVRRRLHPRPLPADHDEAGGARPRHVEPGADGHEDARHHAARVPAATTTSGASPTTTRSSRVIAERYLD